MIKQLLQSQQDTCSNCTQLQGMAFGHILSSTHSPAPSSSSFYLGGTPRQLATPAPPAVPPPPPAGRVTADSGNPPSV